MKYDSVIIGGGLSGLCCGIALAKAKQQVAIVSAGQSTLSLAFSSVDLLGYDDHGNVVLNPLEAIPSLPASHPYHKVGDATVQALFGQAQGLLKEAGIEMEGTAEKNHFRMTPLGLLKPTSLSLKSSWKIADPASLPWQRVTLVDLFGFLDFPVEFIAAGIEKMGVSCQLKRLSVPALKARRNSPSENRSVNVARVLASPSVIEQVTKEIKADVQGEAVLFPALLQGPETDLYEALQKALGMPVCCISTLPPSLPGMYIQRKLQQYFVSLGGTLLQGDRATGGIVEGNLVKCVQTANLAEDKLYADHFVLASGSFMSGGLQSNYERVYEPVFNLDVDACDTRSEWTEHDALADQPYMTFGVSTDTLFHGKKEGQVLDNLFAIGQVLSGHNSIKSADSESVSMLTGLKVAQTIMKK